VNPTRGGWLIILTFLVALLLTVVHLPESWPQWIGWLRPAWVMLVVFFWVLELPERMGLVTAWILGLLLDVLYADPLGLNGVLLASVTYVGWRFYERLRMYSILQQAGVMFLLVLGAEALRQIVQDLAFDRGYSWGVLFPALISMLLWPFLVLLLTRLRLRVGVQ
jgi:rod shape-determining protein MreD